ncbi:hypothetical protein BLOT_010710 [Blomia tropicalis]|nr:hypothetical protein BLOT_010710 [Blomia tropicalis]
MKNADDAFNLCLWKKNQNVRSIPIINANPLMNNRFPTANKPLSNNINTPRNRNVIPKAVKPRPIFCVSEMDIMLKFEVTRVQISIMQRKQSHYFGARHLFQL